MLHNSNSEKMAVARFSGKNRGKERVRGHSYIAQDQNLSATYFGYISVADTTDIASVSLIAGSETTALGEIVQNNGHHMYDHTRVLFCERTRTRLATF